MPTTHLCTRKIGFSTFTGAGLARRTIKRPHTSGTAMVEPSRISSHRYQSSSLPKTGTGQGSLASGKCMVRGGVGLDPLPTEPHREVLATLLLEANIHANLIPDAHLAALAIEHGLLLCSTDGDFGRFSELRWENPLMS